MGSREEKKEEMILLDFWPSMFAMRVKIALAEKGITDYVTREENIVVSKSPLLLEMNPLHQKVPVLIHNGKPVCESLIIVEYLDDLFHHTSPLLPSHPYLRSQSKFWAHFIDTKIYPTSYKSWTTKGEIKEEAKKEFIQILKTLEKELGDKCYFGGDTFGFVDIALISFHSWFYTYEYHWNLSFEAECPNIIAWTQRCLKRSSVSTTLPGKDKIFQAVLEFKKIRGIE